MGRLATVQAALKQQGGNAKDEQESLSLLMMVGEVSMVCERYELNASGCINRMRQKIDDPGGVTTSLPDLILELRHRISDELQNKSFIYIPNDHALFYQRHLLSGETAERFPKAALEMERAGNCYATSNYTACVFHLMRAVEIGARCMVKDLKVTTHLNGKHLELCDWGTLATALQKGVESLAVGTRTSLRRKRKFEFYNHALGSFRNFKDAWRNHVSHTREAYDAKQAKEIIDYTRQFMSHLATRVKEPRRT